MYIVEDTVEKSIYDISVSRRLAHMGAKAMVERSEEASVENQIEAANTMEMEQTALSNVLAKGSGGGEVVGKEDLWNCLGFQHRIRHSASAQEVGGEVVGYVGLTGGERALEVDGQAGNRE